MTTTSRPSGLARAAGAGALAGLFGAGAMLVTERGEQAITSRPNSFMPGRALLTLLGRPPSDEANPVVSSFLMHSGTGAVLGALRGAGPSPGSAVGTPPPGTP